MSPQNDSPARLIAEQALRIVQKIQDRYPSDGLLHVGIADIEDDAEFQRIVAREIVMATLDQLAKWTHETQENLVRIGP